MIHPVAWLGWLTAVLVALSLTRNPIYLGLVLLWIGLVTLRTRFITDTAPIPISPVRFGLFVVTVTALFNGLTVHIGQTVLLRLPEALPLVGGRITLEAVVFGALNGLVLTGIFAAFSVINRALPVRDLIRLIPRAFYPVAVMASIAVTFVPVTLRQFQQIKEAQAVRGHRVRGLRDWLPLVMPLLIGGLERALHLAEAMTARGFASTDQPAQKIRTQLMSLAGLALLLTGWLLQLVWGQEQGGLAMLLAGIGLILSGLWLAGRRVPHTVYRPQPWTGRDWGTILSAAVVVILLLVPLPGLKRSSLFYYPYPVLQLPGFDLWVVLATLGLSGPALLAGKELHRTTVMEESQFGQLYGVGD